MANQETENQGTDETTDETTDTDTEVQGTGINWENVAVRDAHGAVDKDATLARCDAEIVAHIANNEFDIEEIRGAVAQVFVKLTRGGAAQMAMMDLQGVVGRASALLDVPYGAETRIEKRIKDFVRGESKRFEATTGAEGSYHIKRGKHGGVRGNSEMYVKEYRALQAKKAAASAK